MKDAGLAHMGVGRAAGKGKAEEAARLAVSSPLLETSINGAKGVLVNVTGSVDIGLEEVETAANLVQQAANPDANIIFGATFDESLEDEIRVTVIATGFDKGEDEKVEKPFSQAAQKVAADAPAVDKAPAAAAPAAEAPKAEAAPASKEEDPFDDIFAIFNKRR